MHDTHAGIGPHRGALAHDKKGEEPELLASSLAHASSLNLRSAGAGEALVAVGRLGAAAHTRSGVAATTAVAVLIRGTEGRAEAILLTRVPFEAVGIVDAGPRLARGPTLAIVEALAEAGNGAVGGHLARLLTEAVAVDHAANIARNHGVALRIISAPSAAAHAGLASVRVRVGGGVRLAGR